MDQAAVRKHVAAQPTVAVAARKGVGLAGIPAWVWVVAVIALGLTLVGLLAYGYFGERGQVPVQLTYSGLNVTIGVSIDGDVEGGSLRWGERLAPIERGVASFEFAGHMLTPGRQELALVLEVPGQDPEPYPAVIDVPLTIGLDEAGLSQDPAFVAVVVRAGEDVSVSVSLLVEGELQNLGGEASETSLETHYRVPVVAEAGTSVFRASVTVSGAQGTTVLDQIIVPVEVPISELLITDPLVHAVTERSEATISGRVTAGTTVLVNGTVVTVVGERFRQSVRLEANGEHRIRVEARTPGALPQVTEVQIRRTDDLRDEASRFGEDSSVRYEQLRDQSEELRGSKVRLSGEVYGTSQTAALPAYAQMLVRDCPRGERCPAWIRLPAGLELNRGDRVSVYGVGSGYQDFVVNGRDGQTRRQSVPRVDAVLVEPTRR
jgi:hypothetical protein